MSKVERNVLVLQGGGALGAYQAGAYEKLGQSDIVIDWVAGISIGAINAAIICGNPARTRVERLRAFWEEITSDLTFAPWMWGAKPRSMYSEMAAAEVALAGAPGFFRPRLPGALWPFAVRPALSFYDTAPLAATLNATVDFDYLNEKGPRLSVGATDIETGNFAYFDSTDPPCAAVMVMDMAFAESRPTMPIEIHNGTTKIHSVCVPDASVRISVAAA
jgi:NTE family protein